LQSRVSKGKMTEERYEKTHSLLTGVLDYDKFKSVDLVIEASFISITTHLLRQAKNCRREPY
jgi:3-hydroxyacyl-CoA dehydrogenase